MIVDVQINLIEDAPIVVKDKSEEIHLVGIEFGLGMAQIMLSLKNATELSNKLRKEIARQKAAMVGDGAKRILQRRDWVKRILVRDFEDEVVLAVETDQEIDLALTREVVTIGQVLGRATDIRVNAHVNKTGFGIGEGEQIVFEKEDKKVEEAPAAASC